MSARDEAIKAIDHVADRLLRVAVEPITPLDAKLLAAHLDHAKENVEAIQETKRKRRPAPTQE